MEKRALKLKLRLGDPPTPETEQMADEEMPFGSDEEVEEEEWAEDAGGDDAKGRHPHHPDDATREKHKKSKKKKKKREKERHRHRHHRDREVGEDEVAEPPAKRVARAEEDPGTGGAERLNEVLLFLVDQLERRDTQHIFANPVTDAIAPGYSSIITRPMDFSTMKEQIARDEYTSLPQFAEDVKLICNNCMTYNQPDTIYFRSAKKLLHVAERMLSKERVVMFRKELPVLALLTRDQLGFDFSAEQFDASLDLDETSSNNDTLIAMKDESLSENNLPNKFEAIPDDLTPEEILEQATAASQEAADKLTQKKPECTLGFLRQRRDGTTSLNFLTGCEGGDPDIKEKPVSLGLLTGKLAQGSATLHNYREDKRNMARPVRPLFYGSYSTFCPSYDSTFANLTKDESEMVHATYGTDTAVQYADSITDFSHNCDTATYLVDQLLNLLTHQQHSRTQAIIDERKKLQEEEEKISAIMVNQQSSVSEDQEVKPELIDFASLRSLSTLGLDTSFLNYFETLEQKNKCVKAQLDENAELLDNLAKTQKERLSKPLPANLNHLTPPSTTELQLAEKVTEGLVNVARQVTPGSLAAVPIVRKALGITMVAVNAGDSNEQIDV